MRDAKVLDGREVRNVLNDILQLGKVEELASQLRVRRLPGLVELGPGPVAHECLESEGSPW